MFSNKGHSIVTINNMPNKLFYDIIRRKRTAIPGQKKEPR